MAAVVEPIISFTIKKIGELVIQEVGYAYKVREKVESIQRDLEWMQSLLQDADRSLGQGDKRLKILVGKVWGIAWRVEDVVDMFRLREERRRRRGSIKKCIYALNDLISLREIGRTIETIKKEFSNISTRKTACSTPKIDGGGGPSGTSTTLQDHRRAAALAEGKEIVGFAEDVDALVERLIGRGGAVGDYGRRRVVSIVAPGGAGKTTLANRIYKSGQVKNHFGDSATAWVCVSQTYNAKHLLQQIAGEVMRMPKQDSEVLCEKALQDRLSDFLRKKKYLIVLDDMWDTHAWDQLKAAFPDENNGSRIIMTTRKKSVALYADPDPYLLPLLNPDDSWKLFLRKAFPWEESSNEIPSTSSSELVNVGKEIVKRCGGLPLAISVVGGLLAAKEEVKVEDWKSVLGSLKAKLFGESVHCGDIIALSYYDLPYYLKPCFLYLGLFPEDDVIPVHDLKMLWIAEGFIQPQEERKNEDTAENYLEELISRSLVQVDAREWDGSVETCRIHDLLREFAISEGKEHNFLEICNEKVSTPQHLATQALWLASHGGAAPQNIYTRNVRSLLCFRMSQVNLPHLFRGLKMLKVLRYCGSVWQPSTLYASIKKLTNLRYLDLQGIDVSFLPSSIGDLNNLETLLLPRRSILLPKEIWRLQRLKHLDAYLGIFEGEPRVDNLKNLHTLKLASGNWIGEEKTASSLGGLRNLMIMMTTQNLMEGTGSLIKKLVNLQSFELDGHIGYCKDVNLCLPSLEHHLNLSVLSLVGVMLERLPQLPPTLTKLSLMSSRLHNDPMPTLETLVNLRALYLGMGSYTGKKISFAQGFPQLKYLNIFFLDELEELVVEQGAMPKLENLRICACRNLNKLSEGLRCITTLKEFKISDASTELKNWLQKAEEEGWYKNQNVTRRLIIERVA